MDDVIDISKNIQTSLSKFASGPMSEVTDLTKQVRDNFLDANSAANIEITGEDKLAKIAARLTGIQSGYLQVGTTIDAINTRLSNINDENQLDIVAKREQAALLARIQNAKSAEEQITQDITSQQNQILAIENVRATVPINSGAYEEYTKQISEANNNLIASQRNLTGIQAQQAGLQDIHDNYLGGIIKEYEVSKDITKMHDVRKSSFEQNNKLSNEQLSIIEQQKEKLVELGAGLDKYIEKFGAVNDSIISSFSSLNDKILSFAESVPVVGGLLRKMLEKPLEEGLQKSKELWQDFTSSMMSDMKDVTDENGNIIESGLSFPQALAKNFKKLGATIAGIGKQIITALLNPMVLIGATIVGFTFLLKGAFSELKRLEDTAREFRFQLGMSAEGTQRLTNMSKEIETSFRKFGIYSEDVLKSTTALSNQFASINYITKSQVAFMSLLAKGTGVAEETIAGAMNNLMKLGATSEGQSENIILRTQKLSEAAGIPFAKVLEDMSSASEDVMKFIGGSAKELAKGVLESRKLGTNIESIASAASSLLNFESSISAEMEASVMFGRHINMARARQLAYQGDTVGLAKEQLRIVQSLGGTENMNYFQKEKLVALMGVELSTLQNMEKTDAQRRQLQKLARQGDEEAKQLLQNRIQLEKEANKLKNLSAEQINQELKDAERRNQQIEVFNAVSTKISGIWTDIKLTLAPIASALMNYIEPALESIKDLTMSFVTEVDEGGKKMFKLNDEGQAVVDTVLTIGSAMMNVGEVIMEVLGIIGSLFTVTDNWVVNLGIAAGVLVGIKATMGVISVLAGKISSSIFGGSGGGAGGGGGGFFGSLSSFINNIKPSSILAVGGAILMVAGAVWIMSDALTKLKDVQLGDLGIMAGGLLTMVGAVALLGAIMKGGSPLILAGAAALALVGVSLIPLAYAMNLATPAFKVFGDVLIDLGNIFKDVVVSIVDGVVKLVDVIGNALVGVIDAASRGFGSFTDSLIKLSEIGFLGLSGVALGITEIGIALAAFGVGSAVGGIGTAIAELFGGGADKQLDTIVSTFERLAKIDTKSIDFEFLKSLQTIQISDTRSLEKLADGMSEFFDALDDVNSSSIRNLPKINVGLKGIGISLSGVKVVPTNVDDILERVGQGINQFFDELDGIKVDTVTQLPLIKQSLNPFIVDFATLPLQKIPENVYDILKNIGGGIEEFIDYLDDGELDSFQKIIKLKPSFDILMGIGSLTFDNIATSTQAFATSIESLVISLSKLDIEKINQLKGIGSLSVDKVELPPQDPFIDGNVSTGTLAPKFMITEGPTLAEVFAVKSPQPPVPETSSLAEFFATRVSQAEQPTTQAPSIGEFFSSPPPPPTPTEQPEISILENKKLKDEKNMTEMVQPVFQFLGNMYNKYMPESIKDKLSDYAKNEYFNTDEEHSMETHMRTMGVNETNIKNFLGDLGIMSGRDHVEIDTGKNDFTSEVQIEQVVQASSWMDQIMSGLLNKKIQGKLYAEGQLVGMNTDTGYKITTQDDGTSDVSKHYDVIVKDLSDELTSSVSERIKTTDHAIKTGVMTDNEFLNEIITARKQFLVEGDRIVTKQIEVMDSTSTIPNIPTIETPTEQFIEVVKPNQSVVIPQLKPNYDFVDSTSTTPFSQNLQIPIVDNQQSQLSFNTTESLNTKILETESRTTSSIFSKIGDFARNILPEIEFLGTSSDTDKLSSSDLDLNDLDTIVVKGQNVFVEEIAKITQTNQSVQSSGNVNEGNNKEVVTKLSELIMLMRNGGISVNMDGKKVSKGVALSRD